MVVPLKHQGDVENVSEDILELLGTVLQNTTKNMVWSSCLVWVDPVEGPVHGGCQKKSLRLFTSVMSLSQVRGGGL